MVTSPRASATGFRSVGSNWPEQDTRGWIRRIAEVVSGIMDGKINATGSVTLAANAASTTITDRRIGPTSKIFLSPTTANAAAALATTYVVAGDGSATVHHVNNAQTDRTFGYAILG
jgi:hypothetical protein